MKKIFLLLILILIMSVALFGCSKVIIEDTIKDWENAINNNDPDALEKTISPDSDFYVTYTVNYLVGPTNSYFYGFIPVNYYNLDINIDNSYANVYADATYKGAKVPGGVLFKMKKKEALLSFIFPEWKVYQYYDNGEFSSPDDAVWRKIKKLNTQ